MSEKVTAMIEEIKALTVLELSELVHALEDGNPFLNFTIRRQIQCLRKLPL